MPAGELKTKLRATVPLAAAVPDDKTRESVCAKETRAHIRKAIAKIDATHPRVEKAVIGALAKVLEYP